MTLIHGQIRKCSKLILSLNLERMDDDGHLVGAVGDGANAVMSQNRVQLLCHVNSKIVEVVNVVLHLDEETHGVLGIFANLTWEVFLEHQDLFDELLKGNNFKFIVKHW